MVHVPKQRVYLMHTWNVTIPHHFVVMQPVRETITSPEMIGQMEIGMNGRNLEDVRMDGKITPGHVPVHSVEALV